MTTRINQHSLLRQSFAMYDNWGTQLIIYFTVFLFSLAGAILLDMGFHVPPERVLLYVLPTTVLLMLVMPLVCAFVGRLVASGTAPSVEAIFGDGSVRDVMHETYDKRTDPEVNQAIAESNLLLKELTELNAILNAEVRRYVDERERNKWRSQ